MSEGKGSPHLYPCGNFQCSGSTGLTPPQGLFWALGQLPVLQTTITHCLFPASPPRPHCSRPWPLLAGPPSLLNGRQHPGHARMQAAPLPCPRDFAASDSWESKTVKEVQSHRMFKSLRVKSPSCPLSLAECFSSLTSAIQTSPHLPSILCVLRARYQHPLQSLFLTLAQGQQLPPSPLYSPLLLHLAWNLLSQAFPVGQRSSSRKVVDHVFHSGTEPGCTCPAWIPFLIPPSLLVGILLIFQGVSHASPSGCP